jgi:transcriptional regulator with XRE-family HTH domain
MIRTVTSRERRTERARRRGDSLLVRAGLEIRRHRLMAGLTLESVGAASGTSKSAVARLELGQVEDVSFARPAAIADAVGLEPSLKLYPTGAPLRDARQIALLGRFRQRLHPSLGWRTEVGLPIEGDPRAWDAVITKGRDWLPVEAETRLLDLQALERRLNLKLRDGGADAVILLVAESRTNRAALRSAPEAWRAAFPVGARAALAAVGRGELPARGAWIVL